MGEKPITAIPCDHAGSCKQYKHGNGCYGTMTKEGDTYLPDLAHPFDSPKPTGSCIRADELNLALRQTIALEKLVKELCG